MIQLAEETDGSIIEGLFAGGPVQLNVLNHQYKMRSGKSTGMTPAASNALSNSPLLGGTLPAVTTANVAFVPYWSVDTSGVSVDRLPSDDNLLADHYVLNFSVRAPAALVCAKPPSCFTCCSAAGAGRSDGEARAGHGAGAAVLREQGDAHHQFWRLCQGVAAVQRVLGRHYPHWRHGATRHTTRCPPQRH